MDRPAERTELRVTPLPDLHAGPPVTRSTLVGRVLNTLAVRPALARLVSDGLIIGTVLLGSLGLVAGIQKALTADRSPLAGMAELKAQVLALPAGETTNPLDAGPPPGTPAAPVQPERPGDTRTARAAPAHSGRAAVPVGSQAPGGGKTGRTITPPSAPVVRALTGEARRVVLTLSRAAGFILPPEVLSRPSATADVARLMASVGRDVPVAVLAALELAPRDTLIVADVTRRLRGLPPQTPAAGANRAAPAPAGGQAASGLERVTGGQTGMSDEGPAHTVSPEAPPAVSEAAPQEAPVEARPAESGPSRVLSANLDNPVRVNWLQEMTEQAVTPLTPRN